MFSNDLQISKTGKLSLAYKGYKELPINVIGKKIKMITYLDLSHNHIRFFFIKFLIVT